MGRYYIEYRVKDGENDGVVDYHIEGGYGHGHNYKEGIKTCLGRGYDKETYKVISVFKEIKNFEED